MRFRIVIEPLAFTNRVKIFAGDDLAGEITLTHDPLQHFIARMMVGEAIIETLGPDDMEWESKEPFERQTSAPQPTYFTFPVDVDGIPITFDTPPAPRY